jgi:hypothetical protein
VRVILRPTPDEALLGEWREELARCFVRNVPDEVFEEAHRTLGVVAINGWNRLNIAYRTTPRTYQPAARVEYRPAA